MHLTNMVDSQGDALRIYNKLMEMDHKSKTAAAQHVTPHVTETDPGNGNNNNDDDDLSGLTIEELKARIRKLSEQLDELRARSMAECNDRVEKAVREKQKEVEAEWREKLRREKSRVDGELDTLMKKEDCEEEKRRLQEQVETLRAIYESGTNTTSTEETNNETKGGALKERESKETKEASQKSITDLNALIIKTQEELQKMTTARNNYMDRFTATEEALENEKERLNKVIRNRDERLEALKDIKDENNRLRIAVETLLNDTQGGSEFDTDSKKHFYLL
jgi:chromosome segregation ATPase